MNRSEFIKIIGAAALVPSAMHFKWDESRVITEPDPFSVIRMLMAKHAKPDWDYGFQATRGRSGMEYTVHLLQNGNYHRETWVDVSDVMFKEGGSIDGFSERAQRDVFYRLMHGVEQWNALPVEKQQEIKLMMQTISTI